MATTPRLWATAAVAVGALLLTSGCAAQSTSNADVDPADGNWFQLGADFNSAWGELVQWEGGPDFSDIEWEVECSPAGSSYVTAVGDGTASLDPTLSIVASGDGTVEGLRIRANESEYDDYLWYTDYEAEAAAVSPGKISFKGNRVTVSGQAVLFMDVNYETPLNYEIRLTCDTMN